MKVALLPVDPIIGDFRGNLLQHQKKIEWAAQQGATLCLFPELSLVGYHPRDLLYRKSWDESAKRQLDELHEWLEKRFPQLAVIVGSTQPNPGSTDSSPRSHINAAVFLHGKQREVRAKTLIPYYDVFHESRYFSSAEHLPNPFRAPIRFENQSIGIVICEDSWHASIRNGHAVHQLNPTKFLVDQGVTSIFNLSASPFSKKKREERRSTIISSSSEQGVRIYYVNQFGAQDDLLFDGDAFVVDSGKFVEGKASSNGEGWIVDSSSAPKKKGSSNSSPVEELARILEEGIRGYCQKNGFQKIVLGLSGGIDSALVAALAVNALGPKNVIGLSMPSKFSSSHSVEDAEQLAANLGIVLHHVPIKMPHSTLGMTLKPFFAGMAEDITEENIQSRLRGVTVMAFSNKFRALALATGNKSEFAMGYSTLYGDMCGALAPIGDLYKKEVYELARWMNSEREVIPERTFTKPPSAELRPNQTDQDTLPPYDLLDEAVRLFVEEEQTADSVFQTLKKAFPSVEKKTVEWMERQLFLNEYKRKQAPPILRVSERAFGTGRVLPLTFRN